MYRIELPEFGFLSAWRAAARRFASHGIAAEHIGWARGESRDLFGATDPPNCDGPSEVTAPASFRKLADTVLCHSDPAAPSLLYAALLRHQSERGALSNPADILTRRLDKLAKSVRRDIHKMHAFVRFRELPAEGTRRRFGAWFEPDHFILEAAAPFFARRFADMDWMIATPVGIARFVSGDISFHPAAPRHDLPADASEALWGTYFANIFNPARLHLNAMRSEMPMKYWKNLPETRLIPEMLATADARVAAMRAALPATPPARARRILDRLPVAETTTAPQTLDDARSAAADCRRCGICEMATQTVWGEGDPNADLMVVGEQPGDTEDLAGKPFVGPAGQLLRALMTEAGTEPAWITNAVKHFKFRTRGKKRLHQNPNRGEIDHCRWWLDLERRFVAPRLTLALGASAAYALTGDSSPIGPRRGRIETGRDGGPVLVTWHPSFILRQRPEDQSIRRAELLSDLRKTSTFLKAAAD